MANEKMYTIKEIAQIFHVSRKTVYDWVRKGKMPVVRSPGGGKMYVPESWLQQQLQISGMIKNEKGTVTRRTVPKAR